MIHNNIIGLGLAAVLTVFSFAQQGSPAAAGQDRDAFAALRVSNVFQDSAGAMSDTVMFFPSAPAGADSWEVTILDSSDILVQRFAGAGNCPGNMAWFGVGKDGAVVNDGFYKARLAVSWAGQRLLSREESFSFMTPPEIAPLTGLRLTLQEDGDKIAVRLPDLLFAVGRADLPRAPAMIDAVAGFLKAHPTRPIYILGHTDDTGSPARNLTLSEQRAKAVYSFLLNRGLPSQRIRYRGLGDSRPMTDGLTAAGRSQNRRVEIWLSKNRSVSS